MNYNQPIIENHEVGYYFPLLITWTVVNLITFGKSDFIKNKVSLYRSLNRHTQM